MAEFMDCVGWDVAHEKMLPLNELRTNIFKFFIDFDIVVSTEIPDDTVRRIVSVTVAEVSKFVVDLYFDAVVLRAPLVQRDDGDAKYGVHINFPSILVSTHESLVMREAIIVALQEQVDRRDIKWETAFDNAPYVGSAGGLRMVMAPKTRKCPACPWSQHGRCESCTNGKVMDLTRRYSLWNVVTQTGDDNAELQTRLFRSGGLLAQYTSIRSNATHVLSQWKEYPGCPSYSAIRTVSGRAPRAGKRHRVFQEDSTSKWPRKEITNPIAMQTIQDVFRTKFSDVYARVNITTVRSSGSKIYAQFSGFGESYCMNIQSNHKNNRVYGVIDGSKARIRCHCTCLTIEGRKTGKMCKDFATAEKQLTPSEVIRISTTDPVDSKSKVMSGLFRSDKDFLASMSSELFGTHS